MRKTILSLAAIMTIMPATLLKAQELPDEINHPPYYSAYLSLKDQRDRAQSDLDSERRNLADIIYSIQRENDNIARLRQSIQNLENERANLEYELPQVQSDLNQTERDASNTQAVINELSNRLSDLSRQLRAERDTLDALQRDLSTRQHRKRELMQVIRGQEQDRASLIHTMNNLDKRIKKAQAEIQNAQRNIRSLTQRQNQIRTEIAAAKQVVQQVTAQVNDFQSKLAEANTRKADLEAKVKQARQKLREAQAAGDQAKVEKIKERLAKLEENYQKALRQVGNLTQRLKQSQQKLAQSRNEVTKLEREEQQLPNQITREQRALAANERDVQQSQRQLNQTGQQLRQVEAALAQSHNRLDRLDSVIVRLAQDVRTQTAVLQNLEVRHTDLDRDIQNHQVHLSGLNNRIANLSRRIQNIESRIPQINREIDSNYTYIAESERSIDTLEGNQNSTERQIADLEDQVSDLTAQTNAANAEYTQRRDLYNHHLQVASDIGAEQTDPAVGLGKDKGSELAATLSGKYADQLGEEVGSFEANLIGMVRAENQGYPAGYQAGHTDPASRQQGQLEGRSAGAKQAHTYAQQNLKPGFFEKHLVAVINGQASAPILKTVKLTESKGDASYALEKGYKSFDLMQEVPNLSQAEISESKGYVTSLDAKIQTALTSEGQVWERSRSYSNASFVYEVPSTIPYQTVDCSRVYKSVADFVSECEQSYAATFKQRFLGEAQEQFSLEYPSLYNEKFAAKESDVRSQKYESEFEAALAVATSEARAVGQKVAYDEEFKVAFDNAYEAELPAATAKADSDAKAEVQTWVAGNPVVTVESHGFSSQVVRGGLQGSLKLVLKNLGGKSSVATGVLKIKGSRHLTFSSQSYRLVDVAARGKAVFEVPFTVNANARSGELATASVELVLPRDKYKPQRVEKRNFEIRLSVNPMTTTDLKYNESPKVKGWRSYYIHVFNFNIAPAVENVAEGYTVKLVAAPDSAAHVDFKESSATSRGLAQGQSFEGKFRYVFKTSARGKTITLYLDTYHKGVLIKRQPVHLKPY